MKKMRRLFFLFLLFTSCSVFAQQTALRGTVLNATTNEPVDGISVQLKNSSVSTVTSFDGTFIFEGLAPGNDIIVVASPDTKTVEIPVTIIAGKRSDVGSIFVSNTNVKDLLGSASFILLDEEQVGEDADQSDYNVSSLLTSSNDVYLSHTAYDFSAVRFKLRGYDNHYSDTYLNGVDFSDIKRGGFSYGMIGGLNDATRNEDAGNMMLPTTYSLGAIGTSSNINMNASNYSKGGRVAAAYTNRNYKLRGSALYSTGLMNNGWAVTGSLAYRWADEGYVEGTFYNSLAAFLAVEKVFNDKHRLSLTAFAAPTQRAQQSAVYQEIADLLDNNYYNSYWGYQNGEKRSARIITTIEPTAILSHKWQINNLTKLVSGLGFNYKKYGGTRIEYNNGGNPNPVYWRNLPNNKLTPEEQEAARWAWKNDVNTRQIDWDNIYSQNILKAKSGEGGMYALLENHSDQINLTFNSTLTTKLSPRITLTAGLEARTTKGMDYATVADLLGASYFENINDFSKSTFGEGSPQVQYDLNNPNLQAVKGDRIRYDYDIYINKASVFLQNRHNYNKWDIYYGMKIGYSDFYRYGNMRNGLAPDNSFGKGKTHSFVNQISKFGLTYKLSGRHIFSGNVSYSTLPPLADNSYLSSRVKDEVIPNLKNEQVFASDINYNISTPLVKGRITAFQTNFYDQVRIYHGYGESSGTLVNMVLYGMEKQHRGIETGVEVKVAPGVTVSAIGTVAEYIYNNNPEGIISAENGTVSEKKDTYFMKNYHVGGTPEMAGSLGVHYFHPKYWFFDVKLNAFNNIYVDPSPLRRTESGWVKKDPNDSSVKIPIDQTTEEGQALIRQIMHQEKFDGGFTVDVSVGKSIRIQRKYSLNINLQFCNILNKTNLKTGGYEYNRYGSADDVVVDRFPSSYYYAQGFNCYLTAGFRF